VEPGTPHGAGTVLTARHALIDAGANVIAPCPSSDRCPKTDGPSWCHFAVRLPRRRQHREIKQAQLSYEDEKYAYIIAAREPGQPVEARVLAPPARASGRIQLELCQAPDLVERTVTKRDGPLYRSARDLSWGSALTPE
jgi:ribosomal protein RSM22 (predicted rRNA methylase)